MTVKVVVVNDGEKGHYCRVREHQRLISGIVYQDVCPPTELDGGNRIERTLVTQSNGTKNFVVLEEGDGEMRFLK